MGRSGASLAVSWPPSPIASVASHDYTLHGEQDMKMVTIAAIEKRLAQNTRAANAEGCYLKPPVVTSPPLRVIDCRKQSFVSPSTVPVGTAKLVRWSVMVASVLAHLYITSGSFSPATATATMFICTHVQAAIQLWSTIRKQRIKKQRHICRKIGGRRHPSPSHLNSAHKHGPSP